MKVQMIICSCLLMVVAFKYGKDPLQNFDRNNPMNYSEKEVVVGWIGVTFDLYKTDKEVRNLLVPLSGYSEENAQLAFMSPLFHPPIYFNLLEDGKNLGQYVLINKTMHKINDGRDSTADYPPKIQPRDYSEMNKDKTIYIGTADGIHVYNPVTETEEKYGTVTEDVIAIDKVSEEDIIYILTSDHKIHKVTQRGTVINRVEGIGYAKDFVVDFLEAIYFIGEDNKPRVLLKNETVPHDFPQFNFDIVNPLLVRPIWGSLSMEVEPPNHLVVFMVDGVAYFLNGTEGALPVPNTSVVRGITGLSVEYVFLHFYAVNGKIYEHSVLGHEPSSDYEDADEENRVRESKRNEDKVARPVYDRDARADFARFKKIVKF